MGEREASRQGKGWFRRGWVLLLGALVGVALILIGNGAWLDTSSSEKQSSMAASDDPMSAYTAQVEQKITSICSEVKGAGKVQVIVTFEGDFTCVYATDSQVIEKDGRVEEHTEYVTVGSGASEQALLVTRTYPRVSGIGIVCEGGGDAAVKNEMISLLSATFGIGSNKIYITEAKTAS